MSVVTGKHVLVVAEFDPDDDTDRFDVEHPGGCGGILVYPVSDGHAEEPDCLVDIHIADCGLDMWFIHAEDPANGSGYQDRVSVGRHEIEAWSERVRASGPWGPEEWDGGLRLVELGSGAA